MISDYIYETFFVAIEDNLKCSKYLTNFIKNRLQPCSIVLIIRHSEHSYIFFTFLQTSA